MLSAKTTWTIRRIIPFGIIWMIVNSIFLLAEQMIIVDVGHTPSTSIAMNWPIFVFSTVAVTVVGLIIGLIEVGYMEKRFEQLSFAKKILYKVLIYGVLFSIIFLITYPIATSMEIKTGLFDKRVWDQYVRFLGSITHLSAFFQLTISLLVSLFYSEITDHIGHGVVNHFFTGKYHRPQQELLVFMFLDMRSSTTIAEQLGHIRYFQLLKTYYAHLSDAVIRYGGAVYQYVGDEMVLTWPLAEGIRKANCLKCFFAMREDLASHDAHYQTHFGVVPTFKAGLHCGAVTTGEIGIVRKEILYTGDVLNASARIQSLCSSNGVDLLVSDDLLREMEIDDTFTTVSIGEIALRGRKEPIRLWTLQKQK